MSHVYEEVQDFALADAERKNPALYTGRVVGRVLLNLFFVVALIEAVFLTEKSAGILEDAVTSHAGIPQILLILFFTIPEIFDLSVAIGLLVAVYRVVLQLREDRELLIVAATGVGSQRLLLSLTAIAGLIAALSLFVSGFVEPYSRFLQRSILFQSTYSALRGGVTPGEFFFPEGYTVFAIRHPASGSALQRSVGIHQSLDAEKDRLILAERGVLDERADGWISLKLQNSDVYDFPSLRTLKSSPLPDNFSVLLGNTIDFPKDTSRRDVRVLHTKEFSQQTQFDRILRFDPRGRSSSERTLPELVAAGDVQDALQCVARSLLSLLAPAIALLAVAFTNRATQIFAPSVALAVLTAIDISAGASAKAFASIGFAGAGAILLAALSCIFGVIVRELIARQNLLLLPKLSGR